MIIESKAMGLRPITVQAAAKINIFLSAGTCTADGFHQLCTLYQAISLYDTITVSPCDTMRISGGGPNNSTNLAWRAIVQIAQHLHSDIPKLDINIDKKIPIAAGLAGGSADAAAVLIAAQHLWQIPREIIDAVALSLGSDVPFALHGYNAIGTGRGEILTSLSGDKTFNWVIVTSYEQLSTPHVYTTLDTLRNNRAVVPPQLPKGILAAFHTGNPYALAPYLHNDLQEAAVFLLPSLRNILDAGMAAGSLAGIVSGSGPTCVFLSANPEHAIDIAHTLARTIEPSLITIVHGPVAGAHII